MAYLSCDKPFGPITLAGLSLSAAAGAEFTVPDDLADEVIEIIQRTPGRTVSVLGYDRSLDLWIGPVDPKLTYSILTVSASADYLNSFQVSRKVVVNKVMLEVGASSGNVSVGVYSVSSNGASAVRMATSGSVASPTASTIGTLSLTTEATLYPGVRYMAAVAADNGTVTIRSSAANGQILAGDSVLIGNFYATHLNPGTYPLPASIDLDACTGTGKSHALYFVYV